LKIKTPLAELRATQEGFFHWGDSEGIIGLTCKAFYGNYLRFVPETNSETKVTGAVIGFVIIKVFNQECFLTWLKRSASVML
jgi:hypothetical protein